MQSYIITIVAIVVAVCAALAALGFRGRTTTIGVDLGTTYSVVCININGKVIVVEDNQKQRLFPSIVSFASNGELYVAHQALPFLSTNPENTIFNSKRFIGRNLSDPEVTNYAEAHPFKVVESNVSAYGGIGFSLTSSGHPSIISPEYVGTQV